MEWGFLRLGGGNHGESDGTLKPELRGGAIKRGYGKLQRVLSKSRGNLLVLVQEKVIGENMRETCRHFSGCVDEKKSH